jgi:hypothetical protein
MADIFHPPYPLIASQSFSRGVPLAQARAFRFSPLCPKGSSQTVLHCAHRATVIHLNDPSKLACVPSLGRAPMLVYVRPSNEVTDDPSKLARYLSGMGLLDLPLRASNEGLLRPRVARAQKIIRLHPLLCSGSTGPTWVSFPSFSSCAFCEQEGWSGYFRISLPSSIAYLSTEQPGRSSNARVKGNSPLLKTSTTGSGRGCP